MEKIYLNANYRVLTLRYFLIFFSFNLARPPLLQVSSDTEGRLKVWSSLTAHHVPLASQEVDSHQNTLVTSPILYYYQYPQTCTILHCTEECPQHSHID